MPNYMDMHNLPPQATPRDLAIAHYRDIETQWKYGVRYIRYWFDPDRRKTFCLVEAPSVDAAVAVHKEAHGFVADRIIEVAALSVEEMLGAYEYPEKELPWTPESGDDPPPVDNAFRTILFTDMEGSTAQTQRLGDTAAMEPLRRHNAIVRECLTREEGTEVKTMGDAFMASFRSVARAVSCAVAIQRGFEEYNRDTPDVPMRVRIGLSAGEPVAEADDLFGAAVQMAARTCAHAEAGQILVPNVVRELCIGKGFLFADRGEFVAKGFEEPVRVYEVRWRE